MATKRDVELAVGSPGARAQGRSMVKFGQLPDVRNDKPFDGDKVAPQMAAVNATSTSSSVRLASFRNCQGHFLHAVRYLGLRGGREIASNVRHIKYMPYQPVQT
jgi:hypothetical protein